MREKSLDRDLETRRVLEAWRGDVGAYFETADELLSSNPALALTYAEALPKITAEADEDVRAAAYGYLGAARRLTGSSVKAREAFSIALSLLRNASPTTRAGVLLRYASMPMLEQDWAEARRLLGEAMKTLEPITGLKKLDVLELLEMLRVARLADSAPAAESW